MISPTGLLPLKNLFTNDSEITMFGVPSTKLFGLPEVISTSKMSKNEGVVWITLVFVPSPIIFLKLK